MAEEKCGFIVESGHIANLLEQHRLEEGKRIAIIHVRVNRGLRQIHFGSADLFKNAPHLQSKLLGSKIYEGISGIYASVYRGFAPVHTSPEIKNWLLKKGKLPKRLNQTIEQHNEIMRTYIAQREARQKPAPKSSPRRPPRRSPKP